MATFPRTEAEIADLALKMSGGLAEHADDFPSPPVSAAALTALYDEYFRARADARNAAVAASEKYAVKEDVLQRMKDALKSDVRYAENQVREDADKLKLLGWGPRKRKSKSEAPGQVSDLEIVKEGPGWISLKWKKPLDGGAVGAYKVEVLPLGGSWRLAGTTAVTEVRLEGLECSVSLDFQVIAFNKVGEGTPSGLETAVL